MAHAWLDSLSEDWVSQPRSDDSAIQLPKLPDPDHKSKPQQSQDPPSRIPRRAVGGRSSANVGDSSVNILSERSANEINMSMRRGPSQLAKSIEIESDQRVVSGSSNGSVVHNTVHHQSGSGKSGQTPEWKRRLLQGEMHYGEQRDLFCSAAEGLQDMFRPSPPTAVDIEIDELLGESTMASSPPMYHRRNSADLAEEVDNYDEDEMADRNQVTPSPSPKKPQRDIKYKLNVEDLSHINSSPSISANQRGFSRRVVGEDSQDESRLAATPEPDGLSRKTSGQSDTRNEDFSSIIIGKYSSEEGQVEFAPVEMPADQLKAKLERLRINQMLLDSKADIQQGFDGDENGAEEFESTDEFARQGGFLNTRRGGRSAEGSFRHRGLSPAFGVDTSEMLAEESLQASTPKQFLTFRSDLLSAKNSTQTPSLPRAPFPSPEKRQTRNGKENIQPGGGSPLKLFGPYDTFTNQTLLRRISQFEDSTSGSPSQQSLGDREHQQMPQIRSSPLRPRQGDSSPPFPGSRSVSEFGAGDLEGYEFSGDLSITSDAEIQSHGAQENVSPRRPFPMAPVFDIPKEYSSLSEGSEIIIRRRRHKSSKSSSSSTRNHQRVASTTGDLLRMSHHSALGAPEGSGTPHRDAGSESKRPRTSPSKDPTPKRRRTLHRSDIAFGREIYSGIDVAHQQLQSTVGSLEYEMQHSTFELAHPSNLSSRSILRPRLASGNVAHKPSQSNRRLSPKGPRALPSRAHVGELHLEIDAEVVETERKPSIRTQDFVDQAAHIMAMIRNKVNPGLASLEESGEENAELSPTMSDSMSSESSREPLSRPPSREGRPALQRPQHRQEDPELVNRLKKYQELSDMGDVISSSIRSMGLARDAVRAAQVVEQSIQQRDQLWSGPLDADGGEMISDLPHVRITANPSHHHSPGSPTRDYPTNSSGDSTNRSYPTGSSRGSDSRKIIMPDSVSHLIPERVGSMSLDKSKQVWVKNRDPTPAQVANILPSDSEDDPFASIPDLSVDMTKEMQNLRLATARKEAAAANLEDREFPSSPIAGVNPSNRKGFFAFSPEEYLEAQADSAVQYDNDSQLGSAETPGSDTLQNEEVVEDGKLENHALHQAESTRRRNITISFSSPVASVIKEAQPEDLSGLDDDPADITPTNMPDISSATTNKAKPVLKSSRASTRQHSAKDPKFIPRPVSRIDEQDEDSTVELPHDDQRQLSIIGETSLVSHRTPDGRRTSLSFILNGHPGNQALSLRGDESAVIGQNVGKLSLSPLSEFTLNNSDQSFGFEVSYVMGHRHMETGDGTKKVMSMTIRDLVDKLSEVEPFEPYWEDIEELDIQDKRLTSLHMLDEFCGKIITLDASKNSLGHLEGVPPTVRNLKVTQNLLTELTSWDHLYNLQYIDISGNEVKSLSALKNLVHLRSVRADNNQLTSLDGLDCHDGILSLRARNNLLEDVDFAYLKLDRLSDLDLAGNKIRSIRNVELLPALVRLKLSKNKLEEFTLKTTVKTLRQLDVNDNDLEHLDLSSMPALHSLHADKNHIRTMAGFDKARRLDSLSLREQHGDEGIDLGFLSTACEIRKLFLSGNYLRTFEPQVDFLNLQLLELANCGLQSLPANLGQLMPNVRTLNLNFNAISDLSPLRFIPRLKKLLASGNRLADSTTVTELLTDFPHLAQLDLRGNPVTLGFYAPLQTLVSTKDGVEFDAFVLPTADVERDALFAKRLDEATRLRRRLHQIVFAASCKRLRVLDGLPMNRHDAFARDGVLKTLVGEGLLPQLDELLRDEAPGSPSPTVVLDERDTADVGHQEERI